MVRRSRNLIIANYFRSYKSIFLKYDGLCSGWLPAKSPMQALHALLGCPCICPLARCSAQNSWSLKLRTQGTLPGTITMAIVLRNSESKMSQPCALSYSLSRFIWRDIAKSVWVLYVWAGWSKHFFSLSNVYFRKKSALVPFIWDYH